ncbi:hypothetical protein Aple_057760 [Acrocarpospora pleiomorpha]|uniref:N-acetyltransferase domain-containing protein n=1 Tax=Acrocarpospora pleiomorpha TaxID=90975 RepID=A0A5M3XND2_9ACTN|nr:GNAT family N-acetyltransferase [Acrocarpospora pleiomorpha]GES22877.1 hypothetical protein Aple_057760 [Acrocarpospora pleiomorpha]
MRELTKPADLRAMQGLTQRLWSPRSAHHVGDLAWGRLMYPPELTRWPIGLWEDGGRVVAWGWANLPWDFRLLVDPGYPELTGEVLRWFTDLADGQPVTVPALDVEKGLQSELDRYGYFRDSKQKAFFAYHRRSLKQLPDPVVPDGFLVRAVSGEADLVRRAAVHRRSWNSTKVTEESYRALMAAWPYRADLDWVAEGPDGEFAASCLIWLDDLHGVGLIEPVGTVPEFRRMGLSRAVCLAALHALRDTGATTAIVYPRGDSGYPIPQVLYRGMGFRRYARTIPYRSP